LSSNASSGRPLELDTSRLPAHVAIIMDGNGRWAKQRLLHRIKGHEKGSETVREIVKASREIGIAHLTLYAFSTENWQRPRAEINALMTLLKQFLESELEEMRTNNIRLNAIGQLERLPADVRDSLQHTMAQTAQNDGMHLHLALSYGGRAEIVRMVREIARRIQTGELVPAAVDDEVVARHLYTGGVPDPDLLIRTSGEMRVSNFLLWQIAYTEIFVTPTLWPDFTREEFFAILKEFQGRERRFGRI